MSEDIKETPDNEEFKEDVTPDQGAETQPDQETEKAVDDGLGDVASVLMAKLPVEVQNTLKELPLAMQIKMAVQLAEAMPKAPTNSPDSKRPSAKKQQADFESMSLAEALEYRA